MSEVDYTAIPDDLLDAYIDSFDHEDDANREKNAASAARWAAQADNRHSPWSLPRRGEWLPPTRGSVATRCRSMKREAFEQFADDVLTAFAAGRLVAIDGHRIQPRPQPSLTLFPKGVGR